MARIFATLVLFSIPAFALDVLSQWVYPSRLLHPSERGPQERTKPVLIGDILYVANLDGTVYAFHRTEGYILWKTKVPGGVDGSLTFARSKVFVGDTSGNLVALYARNGEVAWTFKIQSEWLSPAAISGNRVFATSSSDELYILDEVKGTEVSHFPHRGDEKMTTRGTASPVVFGNEVYQGFADGYVVAVNATTGRQSWSKRLRRRERFYDVDTIPPYVDEKSLIIGCYDGTVYNLDRLNGNVKWSYPVGAYSGFLVEEGRVYFSGLDGNVHALDRDLGTVIWKASYGKGVGMAPARVGENLVVTTSGDPLLVLDPADGKILWKTTLGTGSMSGAVGDGEGWFYALSNYGNIFSFEIRKEMKTVEGPATVPIPSALHRNRAPIIERNPVST